MNSVIIIAVLVVLVGALLWWLWTKIRQYAIIIGLAAVAAGFFALSAAFNWVTAERQTISVQQSFAQFVELKGMEELIVAQLSSRETLSKSQYNQILGLTYGMSSGEFSAVAHYKYYSQLSQLQVALCGVDLCISSPDLQLSLPVAYESQTVTAKSEREWLGPSKQKILDSLQNEFSAHLAEKGRMSLLAVYPTAAESLADIMHQFLLRNGQYLEYQNIRVKIGVREYVFPRKRYLCGAAECNWELRLPRGTWVR